MAGIKIMSRAGAWARWVHLVNTGQVGLQAIVLPGVAFKGRLSKAAGL